MLKKALVPFIGLVLFLSIVIMPGAALVPGDFSITSPYFGEAVDASEKVKFVWSNAAGADGYKIALRDLTTDEKLLDNKDLGNKRSYSVWLEHDHSYRVAVCAYINGEGEVWQECEFFTIPEQVKATPEIISISASPSNAPAGSLFIFTVRANEYTEEVTIEIDGYSIGTTSSYTTKSGKRIFTIEKVITSAGNNREVVAYALENGKAVSEVDCTITVTESTPAGVPTITSHDYGDEHTVGESLTVAWSAPSTNPDSYNVYVYYGSDIIFSKHDITAKKITIPGSVFSQKGTYSVDVYAVKSGYKADNPANVLITVDKKKEQVIETPTQEIPQEPITPSEPVQPVVSPEIYSVSSSPSTGTAGSQFTFTITTNSDIKKVGVEVDGYSVGTTTSYSKQNRERVFTISTIITSTGQNRNVVAYAYDGEAKLSQISASTKITVTDSPSVGVPRIISPTNGDSYTVGESVTITWSAPATNPDSYNVYLIKNGVNTYSKKGVSGTDVTIPSSYLTDAGTYEVTVYAVKSGYKADEPASTRFIMSQKVVETPSQPTTKEIQLNVPYYLQSDGKWASITLGNGKNTIGGAGCTITSLAMVHEYHTGITTTPIEMNKALSFSGSNVVWSSVEKLGYARDKSMRNQNNGAVKCDVKTLALVYSKLSEGKPCVIGVSESSNVDDRTHYVVINGYTGNPAAMSTYDFTILDPNSKTRHTLQDLLNAKPYVHTLVYLSGTAKPITPVQTNQNTDNINNDELVGTLNSVLGSITNVASDITTSIGSGIQGAIDSFTSGVSNTEIPSGTLNTQLGSKVEIIPDISEGTILDVIIDDGDGKQLKKITVKATSDTDKVRLAVYDNMNLNSPMIYETITTSKEAGVISKYREFVWTAPEPENKYGGILWWLNFIFQKADSDVTYGLYDNHEYQVYVTTPNGGSYIKEIIEGKKDGTSTFHP
ncbi:MAG: C39 family peptidase [Methanocorpusculum sp.]|nr:C39 family peptidase [Methanocorpusculum sp.]